MKILSTQYSLKYKALEIYTAGCKGPHCTGCHNPDTWDFSQGEELEYFFNTLESKLKDFDEIIDKVMIFGGEPLDNKLEDVIKLLDKIKEYNKEVWIFTHYELEDIDEKIKEKCDYIKTGRYEVQYKSENHIECGIKLATLNQHIFIKNKHF